MSSTKNPGRVAGLFYLLLLAAPVRLDLYIPTKLFVAGNATATANNIAAHETLFRIGIFTDLSRGTMAIFVALALYRPFKGVDQSLAILMVILGASDGDSHLLLNVLNDAAALTLARGTDFLSVFDKPQRDALAMLFIRMHHYGVVANEIFWGLWLFPMGILTYRSRFSAALDRRLADPLNGGALSGLEPCRRPLPEIRGPDLELRLPAPMRRGWRSCCGSSSRACRRTPWPVRRCD